MKKKIQEIAQRVRELRELSNVNVQDMASHLKITMSQYQDYEKGTMDIPASILFEMAQRLDVDMGLLLTGEETRMHIFSVTRKGKGVEVERQKQYKYENLAEKFIHKKSEPFVVTVEPKSDRNRPSTNSHPGQEFDYVLEGILKIYIHENVIILNEGDSIFFDSSYEHAMEALEHKPAKFLAIVM
jgi:transcriptional regulator with XRE-family HTH domain